MQLYETWLLKEQKSRLNLSDAGAGKTLAAVLASQACNSKLTLIFRSDWANSCLCRLIYFCQSKAS